MWTYNQKTGALTHNDKEVAKGYSGAGTGKNNPSLEHMKNIGPIPIGKYKIEKPGNSAKHGPHAMHLEPDGHKALGRNAFMIHGDSRNQPGTASQGCVILDRKVRDAISSSGDNELWVLP